MSHLRIVTHDGVFHADELLAIAALKCIASVVIERSRDPRVAATADIAVDVGNGPYDHHQQGGAGARPNGIPYAAAGLVWRDYGVQVVRTRFPDLSEEDAARVAERVDVLLIQPTDAADNGMSLYCAPDGAPAKLAVEGIAPMTFSGIIALKNPIGEAVDSSAAFREALDLATTALDIVLERAVQEIRTERVVIDAIAHWKALPDRDRHPVFLRCFVPNWQQRVVETDAKYVVYPSGGSWSCQAVPEALRSYQVRAPLPEAWAGLSGDRLAAVTGVADAEFCHPGRFIAKAKTREGAEALARLALQAHIERARTDAPAAQEERLRGPSRSC